ncbi:MAG: hypothetical protein MW690_000392 [Methanophagales archaeon]|nr:hypothetical protein [Methanophagales archaeon]
MKAAVLQGLELIMDFGYKLENRAAVNQPRTPMVCYAPDKGAVKGRCAMGEAWR